MQVTSRQPIAARGSIRIERLGREIMHIDVMSPVRN
jgi:hypothetical protein